MDDGTGLGHIPRRRFVPRGTLGGFGHNAPLAIRDEVSLAHGCEVAFADQHPRFFAERGRTLYRVRFGHGEAFGRE